MPIEAIGAGDIVWAWDVDSDEPVLGVVAQTFIRQVDGLVIVETGDEIIETTTEHPFWVIGRGWVEAQHLKIGQLLLTSDGNPLPVEKISFESGTVTVYNFEVEDAHDYFVSQERVLVHNAPCPKPTISQVKKALREVHQKVGKQPKIGSGKAKYGSPMRGTPKKGYRLDPGHTKVGTEKGWHINYWSGKRKSGGFKGAVPIE